MSTIKIQLASGRFFCLSLPDDLTDFDWEIIFAQMAVLRLYAKARSVPRRRVRAIMLPGPIAALPAAKEGGGNG